MTIAPLTNDFGSVVQGMTSTAASFTVTNTGESASGTISASIMGSAAANFNIESNGCSTLAAAATCTISVSFTPDTTSAAGQKTATLSVSASPGGSASSSLNGTSVQVGNLAIQSQTGNNFGTVVVGHTSTGTATITIVNTGGTTTGTLVTQFSGADPGEFTNTGDTCNGATVAANATCVVSVTFTPSSAGSKSASISVSGAPGGTISANVTGTAVNDALIQVTPSPSDFGSVVIGATSGTTTFTATNIGGVATGTLSHAVTGLDAANFVVVDSTCDGITLQPLASCGTTVRFAPATAGNKAANLAITGAPGGTGNAALQGNGIPPGFLIITAATPFADTTVGQVSASQTLTVTNTGGSSTGALTTALGGADPSQFIIVAGSNGCAGVVLAANGQCTIAIQFAPTGAGGPQLANISVSGTPGGTVTSSLSGNGIPPALLSINPGSKDFGSIGTNEETAFQTFTITNVGGQNTGVPAVSLGGANASEFNLVNNCSSALAPNATCSVQVRFAPTINGNDTASLDVTAAPGGSVSATLHGAGVPPAQISVVGNSFINFPLTLIGDTSAPLGFTIINNGTETTSAIVITTVGANPGDYNVTNTCTTLSQGAQCTVTVLFKPTATGTRNATVNVAAAVGGNFTVALSGPALPRLQILAPATNPFDFGNLVVNTAAPLTTTYTVINNTTTASAISITNALTGQFSIGAQTCGTLSASTSPGDGTGGKCNLTVTFLPTSTGVKNGTLTLSLPGGGALNSAVQGFKGTGVDSLNIAAVTTTNFGQVAVGTSSSALTFTVNNPANSPTTGAIETTLTGTQFAVVTDTCGGKTLAGGSNCTISVIFLPTVTGAATTTLTVSGAPGGSAPINLTGTGVSRASLGVTGTFAFGNVFAGETLIKTITITNPAGSAPTGTISTSIAGAGAGVYSLQQGTAGDCVDGAISLNAGQSCVVRIKFSPAANGTFGAEAAAQVTVAATAVVGNDVINLTGTSVSTISLAPATFDFGNRVIGTTTNKAFTVTNNSNGAITVNTSTLLPADPDVTIIANTCSGLAAGAQCTVTVRFAPSGPGDIPVQTLTTISGASAGAANGIASSTITGHGLSIQDVEWTEVFSAGAPFDFGTTLNGENGVTRAFTLTNLGETTSGTITGIAFSDAADYTVTADACTGHTLAAGASCAVSVEFTPANSATTVDEPSTIKATGVTGLANTTINVIGRSINSGALTITPTTDSFPDTVVGQTSATHLFTVQNTGLASATFDLATVVSNTATSFNPNPDFTLVPGGTCLGEPGNVPPSGGIVADVVLAAGASCTGTVQFNPSAVGGRRGFVIVVLNDSGASIPTSPYAPLTGTGLAPAAVSLNTTAVAFGNAAVGTTPTFTVTLTNNGQVSTGAINTSALGGADTTQFAITANACVGTLAAGASCDITVEFKPSTVGNKAAHFTLTASPGLGAGVTVNLSGNGVLQATIGVSPSTQQNAGSRAVGANDPGGTTFTVTNGGDVPTGNLSLVLSNNNDYDITGGSCVNNAPMAANSTCTVVVSFDPSTTGTDVTTLTVSANPGGSDTGSITGTGTVALTANPSPVDLGTVAIAGVGVDQLVTFTNNSDSATGLLEPVVLGGANASEITVTADNCAGQVVPAHGTCTVSLVLVPASAGAKTGTLTITGGPGGAVVVPLTGNP